MLLDFIIGLNEYLEDLLVLHGDGDLPSIHQVLQRSQLGARVHVREDFDGVNIAELHCQNQRSVATGIQLVLLTVEYSRNFLLQ